MTSAFSFDADAAILSQATIVFLFVVGAAFAVLWLRPSSLPNDTRRPPGPQPKLLTGNLSDIPKQQSWLKFKELGDQYGSITRLKLLGREHLILSKEGVANDLLRERGTLHSSRYQFPAVAQLLSDNLRPVFLPYNDRWRNGRKFMHHVTNNTIAPSYEPNQSLESLRMLDDLIREPRRYQHWFHRYSAGIIYRLAYGKAVITGDEQVVHDIESILANISRTSARGAYLVDMFPVLMRLPDIIAPFKRKLKTLHQLELNIFRRLISEVEDDMKAGHAPPSWERDMIQLRHKFDLSTDEGAYVVGTLFEAGTETTNSAMQIWLLSIVLHPQWLVKMQAELDAVCGLSRLPCLADMPHLPTVRAVLKEAMRWRPAVPDGVPHMSTKDDVYNGLFIPAGTIIHASNWAIHHDPALYPKPDEFRPERWLDPSFPTYREPLETYPNMHNFSLFGFGRRICPGQNIAERSLNLLTARLAWACDISQARDERGQLMVPPLYDFTDGAISMPKTFPFDLKPRDQERVMLIHSELAKSMANDPLKV